MHIKKIAAPGGLIVLLSAASLLSACSTTPVNTSEGKAGTQKRIAKSVTTSGIPLNCQATVLRPATFSPRRESIRTFEPSPEYKNTPATIEWGVKRIRVEPARLSRETVPAQYKEVTETVAVLRERTELKGIPAVYKTLERPVTLTPGHTRWKKGCVPQNDPTACFNEVPRRSRLLQQQIVDTPAKIIQQRIPAQTIAIKKKVLIKPGQGSGTIIPARYEHVRVGRVSRVWQVEATKPHARYAVLQVQKTERPEQIRQVAVVCTDQRAEPQQIRTIQQRMRQRGIPARVSGNFDRQSWLALTEFQQRNDLFIGAITAETLARLGL